MEPMSAKEMILATLLAMLLMVAGAAGVWWFLPRAASVPTGVVAPAPVAEGSESVPRESSIGTQLAPEIGTAKTPRDGNAAPVPTGRGQVPLDEKVKFRGTPIPGNPDAKGEVSPEDLRAMREKQRVDLFCRSAAESKLSPTEWLVRQRATPRLGAPTEAGSRVKYGGFPVARGRFEFTGALKGGVKDMYAIIEQVRRAALAQGICTWAQPLIVVPTDVDDAEAIEIYLPVIGPVTPKAPLEEGRVEEGLAYVSRPIPAKKISKSEIDAFLKEVRASGATPRGPLLSREDDRETHGHEDDVQQLIQPITVP